MELRLRFLSILTITSLALLTNCGGSGGNETAPEKVQLGKLVKTWKLKNSTSATLNDNSAVAPNGQIETGFTLTISGTFNSSNPEGPYSFSVTGTTTPSPWQETGKWFFGTNPKTQLIRDEDGDNTLDTNGDDLGIFYSIDSNGELTLTFNCPEGVCNYDGARINNVTGNWEFVLIPQ